MSGWREVLSSTRGLLGVTLGVSLWAGGSAVAMGPAQCAVGPARCAMGPARCAMGQPGVGGCCFEPTRGSWVMWLCHRGADPLSASPGDGEVVALDRCASAAQRQHLVTPGFLLLLTLHLSFPKAVCEMEKSH